MGGISGRGLDLITRGREEINHGSAAAKFASLIKTYIFMRNTLRKTMLRQPAVQEIQRRGFRLETFTVQITTVMIRDETKARLAIDALKSEASGGGGRCSGLLRILDDESKVNRHTLVALSRMAGGCLAPSGLM
jgi:hypothetical protein